MAGRVRPVTVAGRRRRVVGRSMVGRLAPITDGRGRTDGYTGSVDSGGGTGGGVVAAVEAGTEQNNTCHMDAK